MRRKRNAINRQDWGSRSQTLIGSHTRVVEIQSRNVVHSIIFMILLNRILMRNETQMHPEEPLIAPILTKGACHPERGRAADGEG